MLKLESRAKREESSEASSVVLANSVLSQFCSDKAAITEIEESRAVDKFLSSLSAAKTSYLNRSLSLTSSLFYSLTLFTALFTALTPHSKAPLCSDSVHHQHTKTTTDYLLSRYLGLSLCHDEPATTLKISCLVRSSKLTAKPGRSGGRAEEGNE